VKPLDYNSVRRRVLMFYLAAGLNLLMGLFVLSAGGSAADRGKLWLIAVIFLTFAGLNYYMARVITKRWDAHVRQQQLTGTHANEEVKK
jgi:uncharacterized membrane protein YdjX (TVP38/TMEM64 family)